MGLYDEMIVEHESMPERYRGRTFQTKCLDRSMGSFKVDWAGLLHVKVVKYCAELDPGSLFGMKTSVVSSKWAQRPDIDGEVEVHIYEEDLDSLVCFNLVFADGVLRSCTQAMTVSAHGDDRDQA